MTAPSTPVSPRNIPISSPFALPAPISTVNVTADALNAHHLSTFLASLDQTSSNCGVSATYDSQRRLEQLAFCGLANKGVSFSAIVIRFSAKSPSKEGGSLGRFLAHLLDSLTVAGDALFAFDADLVAAALFLDCAGVRISHLVDIQSLNPSLDRNDGRFIRAAFGDKPLPFSHKAFYDDGPKSPSYANALLWRAWAAVKISHKLRPAVHQLRRISTLGIVEVILKLATNTLRNLDRLGGVKPLVQNHDVDVSSAILDKKGNLQIRGVRFSTRPRKHGPLQMSRIETSIGIFPARTDCTKGKTATYRFDKSVPSLSSPLKPDKPDIISITTIGKDPATPIEKQVRSVILHVLCGDQDIIFENAIARRLWGLEALANSNRLKFIQRSPFSVYSTSHIPSSVTVRLNDAQKRALHVFCTSNAGAASLPDPVLQPPPSSHAPQSRLPAVGPHVQLVQGPPGTGKTTLIASMAQWLHGEWEERDKKEALYIITL